MKTTTYAMDSIMGGTGLPFLVNCIKIQTIAKSTEPATWKS